MDNGTSNKASCCLYLDSHDVTAVRNIRYLSDWSKSDPQPDFEIVVGYSENLDIANLAKLYPDIRWCRFLRPPMNRFFLYHTLSKKIRSKIFIFISSYVLVTKRDLMALANNSLKKDVLFSYMGNPRLLFLRSGSLIRNKKSQFFHKFGYCLNEARSEIYSVLNYPVRASSIEMFAFHTDNFKTALKSLETKEKYQLFRERFSINHYKSYIHPKSRSKNVWPENVRAYFDFMAIYMASRSKMKIHSPGRGHGRWLIPTHAGFFPFFLIHKQIFLLAKLIYLDRYVWKLVNYKRVLLAVSYLAWIPFFVLSYQGYRDAWMLILFFVGLNMPLLWQSCLASSRFKLRHLAKLFLILF